MHLEVADSNFMEDIKNRFCDNFFKLFTKYRLMILSANSLHDIKKNTEISEQVHMVLSLNETTEFPHKGKDIFCFKTYFAVYVVCVRIICLFYIQLEHERGWINIYLFQWCCATNLKIFVIDIKNTLVIIQLKCFVKNL